MLSRIVLSVIVAIAVALGCVLLGLILGVINLSIALAVGDFLKTYAVAIGLLSGLWFFFTGSLRA